MAELLLLNGSPSAGKTTLAKVIQERAPMPLFHRSLDDFLAGYREPDASLFDRVMVGYLGALHAMVVAGNDVVAEAVIIPERADLYAQTFADVPVILIGVHCPLAICRDREAARGRPGGPLELDVEWFETVHHMPYDLEVDASTHASMLVGADQAIAMLQAPPRKRAFARLH